MTHRTSSLLQWLGILALVLSGSGSARAAEPTFDCTKASHEIEKLICQDDALARLDVTMDRTFRAAEARLSGRELNQLRSVQRGWVKGRDDCWKESDKRQCVVEQYTDRIVSLQVEHGLVPARAPVTFTCDGSDEDLVVTVFESDPPAARFTRGDEHVIMIGRRAGSGARYEGDFGVSFWEKGGEAVLTWPQGRESRCRERK